MTNFRISNAAIATSSLLFMTACGGVDFKAEDRNAYNAEGDVVVLNEKKIDVTADRNVDILFIVDNSGSMAEEQQNFANKIKGFMNVVKDLNWHVALTTTDPRTSTVDKNGTSRLWGDGQLRPFDSDTGSLFVLKSSEIPLQDAQVKLASAIEVGTQGSGAEHSLYNTYRAIERRASTTGNSQFFRKDARLAVIAISDEEECGGMTCQDAEKSKPQNLVDFVHSEFGADKIFAFNSIIKSSTDSACSTAIVANVYEALSKLTGGVIGSVCANDYTASLASVGSKVLELVRTVNLDCVPEDMNGDGVGDVQITLASGEVVTSGFNLNNTTLTFHSALSEGEHTFRYFCVDPTATGASIK